MPGPVAVYVVAAIAGFAAVVAFKEVPFSFTPLSYLTSIFTRLLKPLTDGFFSLSSNHT